MRAVGDRVVIEEIKEAVSVGGIKWSASDTKQIRYGKAKVITAGELVKAVQPGDIIYYDLHRAFETVIDTSRILLIRESDVVVVLD